MAKAPNSYSDPNADTIAKALKDRMQEILALIEAIAAEVPDTDMKLAEMLEGEPEVVRIAIIEKLRELLKEKASEKETELEKIIEAQKRQVVERQRNVFMQWLQWIMSEETLRKIRMAFLSAPGLESHVRHIGQELAAKGVLQQLQPNAQKQELGGLSANAPAVGQGQGKDTGKGRQ
jgi:hypothetical protein